MYRYPRLLLPLLFASMLSGCGPKGEGESDASSEGSGTTGTASGTTSTASGTATEGATTEGATTGSGLCAPFVDQAIAGPEVVVTIENTRNSVVFVLPGPACTSDPRLQLRDGEGESLRFRKGACEFTCDQQFAGNCICAADCALAPAIRLEPGGVYSYTWAGGVFVPVTPPLSCFEMECGPMCDQRQQAAAGQYTFTTEVGASVPACTDNPDLCMCTPGPEGWCELYGVGSSMIEEVVPASGSFSYPNETAVALVVP